MFNLISDEECKTGPLRGLGVKEQIDAKEISVRASILLQTDKA